MGTSVKRPRLTDGIHFPASVAAGGKVTFGATYYDAAVGPGKPQVFVAVDGACTGLAFVRGTTSLGAYEGQVTLADGCHPYYFVATLGDGVALATYPDTGALQVGAGTAASTCALFGTTRPAATCAGMGGGGSGTGAAGASGAAGATGAAGSTGAAGMKGTGGAGGAVGAGGATGAAGMKGTGGSSGAGGAPATTGAAGTPGAAGSTGTGGVSAGGAAGVVGATGAAGSTSGTGGTGMSSSHLVGTGCAVAPEAARRSRWLWVLALGVAIRRARRRQER